MKVRFMGNEPTKAHADDAGFDLAATRGGWVRPGAVTVFGTGTHVAVPRGHVGLVFGRSGLGFQGIAPANAVGVIDPGYTGEIRVALVSNGDASRFIAAGDRIAQLVLVKAAAVEFEEVDALGETERGESGFGGSGA